MNTANVDHRIHGAASEHVRNCAQLPWPYNEREFIRLAAARCRCSERYLRAALRKAHRLGLLHEAPRKE